MPTWRLRARVTDKWCNWLVQRRAGGDAGVQRAIVTALASVRDRVLDNARIVDGVVLLDVGTGDGLVGVAALRRVGPRGRVIFSDISPACLRYVQTRLTSGDRRRASFVLASAEDLAPISSETVDVVTTRSVIMYVLDKRPVFGAFYRVLRHGGRISLAEPLNRDYVAFHRRHRDEFFGYSLAEIPRIAAILNEPGRDGLDSDPMTNFTHVDLATYAEESGFADIHIDVDVDVRAKMPLPWRAFLAMSPNPNAPTIGEELAQRLNDEERREFERVARPKVEQGLGVKRDVMAYVRAVKR